MPLREVTFKLRSCEEVKKKLSKHRKETNVTTAGIVIEGNRQSSYQKLTKEGLGDST